MFCKYMIYNKTHHLVIHVPYVNGMYRYVMIAHLLVVVRLDTLFPGKEEEEKKKRKKDMFGQDRIKCLPSLHLCP